jgi:hypothetical protein
MDTDDDVFFLNESFPIEVDENDENQKVSTSVMRAYVVSKQMECKSGPTVSKESHSRLNKEAHLAVSDAAGPPAWYSGGMEELMSLLKEVKTKLETVESIALANTAKLETVESKLETVESNVKSKLESYNGTVKAVGKNATIRSVNQHNMVHKPGMDIRMIVLENGAHVGQVPQAITDMAHQVCRKSSVLQMNHDSIDRFATAYGSEQVSILFTHPVIPVPHPGILVPHPPIPPPRNESASERAQMVLQFMTSAADSL